jgi:AcrR family transcriptional regulator
MSSSRAEETREAILDAARALFETDGHSVGLETVARKAGVSRQAIYLHFSSRADLVRALHERINVQDVAPAMARVWGRRTALAGLDAFLAASAEVIPRISGIADALAPSRADPDLEATGEAPRESRYADCLRMGEWLERDGMLAAGVTAADAADVLCMMVSIPSYQILVVDRRWSSQRWTRWLRVALHQTLLGSREAPSGGPRP